MKKSKQLLLITALLFIWELPVIAQQPTDTTYIFRFVPNDDMFYVPWNGNDRSLHQLLNILEKNKKQLQAGQMYISVSSYAASANDILTSERMAYIRNNRIKSELITQGGLTEQMFVTDRAILSSYGKEKLRNVVVVTFPASVVEKPCDFDPFGQTGLSPFGYNMIDPLKSWCWGSILFYPFKISRFS